MGAPDKHVGQIDAGEDGLDEEVWARLMHIVRAANRADALAYAGEVVAWRQNFALPGQHRMGLYLMYLLSYRVKEVLRQNKPTDNDLHEIAVATYPRVQHILDRTNITQLEETVRIAFDRPPLQTGVTPGEFMIFAGALLGVLMTNPDEDLKEIRPRLAAWWQRHYRNFRSQGLIG